jgi:hypothetical protein
MASVRGLPFSALLSFAILSSFLLKNYVTSSFPSWIRVISYSEKVLTEIPSSARSYLKRESALL